MFSPFFTKIIEKFSSIMIEHPTLILKNGLLFPFQFQILGYALLFARASPHSYQIWGSIIFIFARWCTLFGLIQSGN